MNFPVEIPIGSVKILLHSITEPLGIFVGFRYFLYLRKKQGDVIHSQNRIWILIAAIFGALFGSRLLGGLENYSALMQSPNKFVYFYENKTVLGGFLGGLFGVELVKKIIKEKHASGDLFTYPMILALIIGRIGCLSMGVYEETYGLPTKLPWGMHLGDSYLRHPVSLYEIIFLILLWIAFVQTEKNFVLQPGARFKIFMMAYCIFRFMLDFIKPTYTSIFGVSTIQITALLGLIYYYRYIIHPRRLFISKEEIILSPTTEQV